jgi:hypothetical protein
MKKMMITWCAALAAIAVMGSCGSTQRAASSAAVSVQAARTADNMVILDWKDRSLGELAAPVWLLSAVRGDWKPFKETWTVAPGKILKLGASNNAMQNTAMTIADVQYAARLANQLKQSVLTRAGISLGSDGEFDAVNDAATKTLVTIAGQERLTDFWQKVELTDSNGKKQTAYNYYVVYACDEAIWDQLVGKYIFDVVGQLPEKKTQQTIAGLFKEIDEATKAEKPLSEEEFRKEVAAREAALERGGVPKAEQRAAYRSGDPVNAAAASTTPADKDYVAALSALSKQ